MFTYRHLAIMVAAISGISACQPMVYGSAGNTSPHMPPEVWTDWADRHGVGEVVAAAGEMWAGEKTRSGRGWGATRQGPNEGPHSHKPITGSAARAGNFVMALLEIGLPGLPGAGFDASPGIVCDPTGVGLR